MSAGLEAMQEAGTVRGLGTKLVSPELIIFPVRHHSPACAWQLQRLLSKTSPCAVLVEGPRSFSPLIPTLASPEARMPLAIYTYFVGKESAEGGQTRRAAYYPFCDYSPALLALRDAHSSGIPARFIDLDFEEQCIAEALDAEEEASSLLDERYYRRSRYLAELARMLGYRDPEELWEHLFEVAAASLSVEEHVSHVAAYCHLSRTDYESEELARDGTLDREREMAWQIRQALEQRAEGSGPVLAVMGGFHAVVMPELLSQSIQRPAVDHDSASEKASAVIRYSFDRLDRLNGYSAGMRLPAWHQQIWEQTLRHDKPDQADSPRIRTTAALAMLSDIATELRLTHGVDLPMPAFGAAYEHCLRLCAFRNRHAPTADDVVDSITSCFVKGDADVEGALILGVARRLLTGNVVGKVPAGSATPPLVKDFSYRARRQRLRVDDADPRRSVLDIYRRVDHRVTSRLFHGMAFLGIPFAIRDAGPDFVLGTGLDRLQEHWQYAYTAATEAALVEASIFGVTVPLAVANRFTERVTKLEAEGLSRNAGAAAGVLTHACVLGLHDHLPRLLGILRHAIADDPDFESVAAAAGRMGLLWQSREPLEARDVADLPAILRAAYERATYLGLGLRGERSDGSMTILHALTDLRELLVSESGRALDDTLYWSMVEALHGSNDSAIIRGAAAGLLFSSGRVPASVLATGLAGHLGSGLAPKETVGYLGGLLHTAREAAWQQPDVMQVLDGMLDSWPESDFLARLPELRLAFAEMTPKETDRIAESVARLHGASDLGTLVRHGISEQQVHANIALSGTLRELLAADGLDGWLQR